MRALLLAACVVLAGCTGPAPDAPAPATHPATSPPTPPGEAGGPAPRVPDPEPDVGPPAPLHLLRDEGFEDEPPGWRVVGNATRACGDGCWMRLQSRGAAMQDAPLPPAAAGALATLALRLRGEPGAPLLVELTFDVADGSVLRESRTLYAEGAWRSDAAVHARVPVDATRARASLWGMGAPVEVDDAQLVLAPRPVLVRNGGFEQGEDGRAWGWDLAGAARACGDLPPGARGSCALRFVDGTRASAAQVADLPPGTRGVLLFAHVRAHDADDRLALFVNATLLDADGGEVAANGVTGGGAGPVLDVPVQLRLDASGAASRVRVEVTMLGSPGTAWLDDVDLLVTAAG